jgi:hypothetical protein
MFAKFDRKVEGILPEDIYFEVFPEMHARKMHAYCGQNKKVLPANPQSMMMSGCMTTRVW